MFLSSWHRATIGLATAAMVPLVLGACSRFDDQSAQTASPPRDEAKDVSRAGEMAWARMALARNPMLEVVATDTQNGVFTVRSTATGETQVLRLEDLAAAPVSTLVAAQGLLAHASASPEPPPAARAAPAAPAPSAPLTPEQIKAAQTTSLTASLAAEKGYTVQRENGQIKISGPGLSIVSTGTTATPARDSGRRSVEPVICEGKRMLQLDSRDIYVDGDAITARGGCELFISNSRIVAAGTGVVIQDATVHISNSTIEGDMASFDASDEAKVYLRASTFHGLPRRGERAVIQDQGGNQWK